MKNKIVTLVNRTALPVVLAALLIAGGSLHMKASAQAGAEQMQVRADLKKLEFVQKDASADNLKAFPFMDKTVKEIATEPATLRDPTKYFVAEADDKNVGALKFFRMEGPLFCGSSDCAFSAYAMGEKGLNEVINTSATDEVYLQDCGKDTNVVFIAERDQAAVWTYKDGKFEMKQVYDSLADVPACK